MALRNSGDVGLDSGSVNMDKFEAPISETIRHPDRRENDNGGSLEPGYETGRIDRRATGQNH